MIERRLKFIFRQFNNFERRIVVGKKFDKNGLLLVIREIGKGYRIPLPKFIETHGFCSFCLGANVPNQNEYPDGYWCCAVWCDELLPVFKICKLFKVDKKKVKEFAESIRPDGTETMSAYEHTQK